MRMGRASAYGLLALMTIDADSRPDGCVTAMHISQAAGVPVEYLRKILQRLTRARLVHSERGRTGGFRLRRPFGRISVLQVIEAVEGPVDHIAFFDDLPLGSAPHAAARKLRRWRRSAASRLRDSLRNTSLEQVFNGHSA